MSSIPSGRRILLCHLDGRSESECATFTAAAARLLGVNTIWMSSRSPGRRRLAVDDLTSEAARELVADLQRRSCQGEDDIALITYVATAFA